MEINTLPNCYPLNIYLMKLNLTCTLLLMYCFCFGQNLIPNGDFEGHTSCPGKINEFNKVMNWIDPYSSTVALTAKGTPDYFNHCDTSNTVSVPFNFGGYQQAYSGLGYCGISLFHRYVPEFREYVEVMLTSPLVANKTYHFEMLANLANVSFYSSPDVGIYFSDTAITGVKNYNPFPFVPQITNPKTNDFDTIGWTPVTGNYTAHGGEQYLIIGNFKNDASTDTVKLINDQPNGTGIYIYLDDVSLSLTTNVNETKSEITEQISPNPFSQNATVTVSVAEPTTITLYDFLGQQISQQTFVHSTDLNTAFLAKGIYFYAISNAEGILKTGKVTKQ